MTTNRPTVSLRTSAVVVLPWWVAARVLVGIGWLVARVGSDHLAPGNRPVQLQQGLLLWDGSWYRRLAEHGYSSAPHEALRFFPGHVWLGKAVGLLLADHPAAGLVVVANMSAFVALVLLHQLATHEGFSAQEASFAVAMLAMFPSAAALVWGYSEGLFLVGVVGCFLGLRRQWWWWAALAALVAALTRPVGVLLVLPAVVEVLRARRGRRGLEWPALATLAAPVIGLAVALANSAAAGEGWLAPLRVQEPLRGDVVEPVTRLAQAVTDLFDSSQSLADGLHAPFAVAFVVLAVVAARTLPASYSLFAAAMVAVALAAENLNSLERYALGAFPLVLAATALTRRLPTWRGPLLSACGGSLVALSALSWIGSYVP